MVTGLGLLAVSAVLLIAGAELFTENGAGAARRLGIAGLGAALLLAGVALLWWRERQPPAIGELAEESEDGRSRPPVLALGLSFGGIALMIAGGWLAVGGAERVVAALRISDSAVGLTLLALATTAE